LTKNFQQGLAIFGGHALKQYRQAAEKILAETVPGDTEAGFDRSRQLDGRACRLGLAQKVEWVAAKICSHQSLNYNVPE
jgi:hypothetical protein